MSDVRPTRPRGPQERTCPSCGSGDLQEGFLEDSGEASKGFVRWIAGPLERGVFGGAKRAGRPRWVVDAHRCAMCSHVALFASRRA